VQRFWAAPVAERNAADRQVLAPARRACGLTSQDAEEALDRVLQEPGLPALAGALSPAAASIPTESALTFTTYIRRFTQCLTTLASVGTPDVRTLARLDSLNLRLAALCATLDHTSDCTAAPAPAYDPAILDSTPNDPNSLAEQMLQRMERQAFVLERAAAALTTH
jgi:hypothetical protein